MFGNEFNVKAVVDRDNSDDPTSETTLEASPTPIEHYVTQPSYGFSTRWSHIIKASHKPIKATLQKITQTSARNPKGTILTVVILSFTLLVIGLFTGFNIDVDEDSPWTPRGSISERHGNWIEHESGFPKQPRFIAMLFHSNGANVLGQEQISRIFEAVDMVRALEGFNEVCEESSFTAVDGTRTCEIHGVTRFWNSSTSIFESEVASDEDAIEDISRSTFADGIPVVENAIFGHPDRDSTGLLTSVHSYTIVIMLPDSQAAEDWELVAVDALLDLDDTWNAERNGRERPFRIEAQAGSSFSEEFTRAITNDIPLIPMAFIIMSVFTCCVFARRHKIYSRSLLGHAAVVSVLLSIMSGFGLLFIAGVPFTSMTQCLPFIIVGIGLDDAFILMGSYARTDHTKDPEDRIAAAVDDIGLSVVLTTSTSALAFGLGCISSIPAVFWLGYYTFPTIIIVLLYQLTFFVACIVLDEQRITAGRRDCCVWVRKEDLFQPGCSSLPEGPGAHVSDHFMVWYADKLLRPSIKALVVLAFAVLTSLSAWSASKLSQSFKFTEVIPEDSYVTDYFEAAEKHSTRNSLTVGVYFRFVDQSDSTVQQQMQGYLDDLVAMESVHKQPDFFWLRDFLTFANDTEEANGRTFPLQVAAFLTNPIYRDLYNDDIIFDGEGNVIESRTFVEMTVDFEDVGQQIDTLKEQRAVMEAQPVNRGRDRFAFFTYEKQYNIWEFYSVCVEELILTTVIGVISVTGVAFLFIPHWSAAVFVFPLICMLYMDLLGFLQWAGVHVNAVSYISIVMSIGLMVDYIVHVLFRYYELSGNRREKTEGMLRTMGASILVGGISTFLGTLPLAFSTSNIFNTIFFTFLGLVMLGVAHGLILLPVILSTIGPEQKASLSMH